ncbi:MAG: energy-coupling factor transporter transmembrane component T [Eubacteriales bacterium]|nr:energy-coupling factor transporter transmembrane component T [Eubacteriales bacterium]
MIGNITIGQYLPGESLLHRADPRTKIILSLYYMILIFIIKTYAGFALALLFIAAVTLLSGIPVKHTIKGLRPIIVIIIFTAMINIFTTGGTTVFSFYFIKITYEGIELAAKMALRLILLVTGASLLTLTTTPISLTDGIESLMKPLSRIGVPAHEIAMMMSIALRFIPTLLDEADKIMKAQSSRGADFDTGNLVQKAKSFIPVLVPLFVSAFRRADELATAMEARCYRGGVGRTRMRQLRFGRTDFSVAAIIFLFTCVLAGLEILFRVFV